MSRGMSSDRLILFLVLPLSLVDNAREQESSQGEDRNQWPDLERRLGARMQDVAGELRTRGRGCAGEVEEVLWPYVDLDVSWLMWGQSSHSLPFPGIRETAESKGVEVC